MNVIESLAILTGLAQAAQTSGVVPAGPYAKALAVLVVGSQAALRIGKMDPTEPIEIDDIGDTFDAALVRMRDALAEGNV